MRIRQIRISGPFSDEEIIGFIALLRRIDQTRVDGVYKLTVIDPESSLDESERFLREALPPLPDRATAFARAAYRDDSYPERECDHCHRLYRGPAVVCSLDCAIASA